jgi:hypothetical protein
MLKLTIQGLEGKGKIVYINPNHVVSIQEAQQGCLIHTTRTAYHVDQTADMVINATQWAVL